MRHVVITGAASGIGWALAKAYWHKGDYLHLVDADAQKLQLRRRELPERVSCYQLDLLDDAALEAFARMLVNTHQPVARLINNAGITHRSPASKTDKEVFKRVMKLNWQVPVTLSQALLPLLSAHQGKIINIASMAALMPVPGRAAYCASKAALDKHFETWRPELMMQGIDLLMVFPSFVATNIEANALDKTGQHASHPQSKIGRQLAPQTMAELIVKADSQGKQRYLSNTVAPRIGYWLWFLLPGWFQRITWRKFAGELS